MANVKWFMMNSAAVVYYWNIGQMDWSGIEIYQKGWKISNIYHLVLWISLFVGWFFNLLGNIFKLEFMSLQFAFLLWIFQFAFPLTLATDAMIIMGRNDMFDENWTPSADSQFYWIGKLMLELLAFAYGSHLRKPLIAQELKFTAPIKDPDESLF